MKKMRKMKERIFSVVLTLVMVVALFAGMAPLEVHAAAAQAPTEEELNCKLTTVDVTLEVGEQYIQCSQLPEVTSENYKWAYFYYPASPDMEGYEEGVLGLIASVRESIGVNSMSNCKAAHREEYGLLVKEIPSNGQIPVSGDGYGVLYIVQIYDYHIDVDNTGYRYYYNKVAIFDVSKGGTVSNGLVGEETTPISITKQPASVTVNLGEQATFTVEAEATGNLTYKWQVAYGSGKEFGDAYGYGNGTATFTTYSTEKKNNGYRYRCIITDENENSVTSDEATLTLIGAEPPTQIPGVSIAKTADGYKVTGLGAVEEGYRWGYYPIKLREGQNLDEAVAARLNEHFTDGPFPNELANFFDESYEIATYTFPGRAPETLDNYDYIEFVKLDERGYVREVAVLPLPKSAAPEVTYDITLDRTNYADGYVDLYTYNSEGRNVANTQDNNVTITMPEGGKVRVFADSEFTVTAEGATISEMLGGGEEGYYYELTGIAADTTIVVNKGNTGSGDNFIDTVHVNFDWQEVPLLVNGSRELPSFSEATATVTVDGAEIEVIRWGIKVTDSLKVTEEDDYYNEALVTVGAENINEYNSQISRFGEVYGWAPLEMVLSNPYYKINENDVYAAYVAIVAEDGKCFGTLSGDEYLGNLTCNVEVGCKLIDGNGEALVVFFELGTLAEMEEEKNEAGTSVHTHSLTLVPEKAATCAAPGNKAYYTCSGCDNLFADANGTTTTTAEAVKIAALGHDWSGEWTIIKEATDTKEGKQETYCVRDCGQKKVAIIPVTGTTDDNGNLEKDAEVEAEAPIDEATLNNSKEELLEAGNIFIGAEKTQIANGADARVWLEISKTDKSTIASTDEAKIKQEATQIMGDNLSITYFDADLFKQVGTTKKIPVPEPGIKIKITITIPDELLNSDKTVSREYKIIRLHEGQVDVINGAFDATTGEFTFESDKFSTYAIVYKDVPVNENNNPTPEDDEDDSTSEDNDVVKTEDKLDEVPDTGDSNITLYSFVLMLLSGLGIIICSRNKKIFNKES